MELPRVTRLEERLLEGTPEEVPLLLPPDGADASTGLPSREVTCAKSVPVCF
jgi:hypothetical protein